MTVDPRREQVVKEAEKWLWTPYHHEAMVLKAGVDCGKLLIAVYSAVGIMPEVDVEHYPNDFMLHRDFEWYQSIVEKFSKQIEGPPGVGDVVLFKFGRLFAHGAIVIEWPRMIHAWAAQGLVCYGDATLNPLADRERKFYCPFND